MTLKMNRETGLYEARASFKFWLGLAVLACTVVTAVVTYTITLTLAFSGVRQDIALLTQKVELQQEATDQRLKSMESQMQAMAITLAAQQRPAVTVSTPGPSTRNGGG